MLALLFFRGGGGSAVQQPGGGELVGVEKKRVQYVLRKQEFEFLEEIQESLSESVGESFDESQTEYANGVSAAPVTFAEVQKLSQAYQTSIDSLDAALAFIELRKRELLIEDEMAIFITMMADES